MEDKFSKIVIKGLLISVCVFMVSLCMCNETFMSIVIFGSMFSSIMFLLASCVGCAEDFTRDTNKGSFDWEKFYSMD